MIIKIIDMNKKRKKMINLVPEKLAFKLQCTECDYNISVGENDELSSIVSLSEHIERTEHIKYDLEIYDFDLKFVKESTDIVRCFDDIDDKFSLLDLITKLKNMGYKDIGPMIKNALQNDMLYVCDIEDVVVYFAQTDTGKDIWEMLNKEKWIKKMD